MLYSHCPHCGNNHLPVNEAAPEEIDPEWERVIEDVFKGNLKDVLIDKPTALAEAQKFVEGVREGFGDTSKVDYTSPDYGVLKNLERNCYQFAGAKNYQELRALNDLLRDGDRLRSRSEFMKEARQVVAKWNGNYQRTEYDTALNSAINARKWQDFKANEKIMPLLRFKIVGDEHTCPICLPFADMTLPMSHPAWNYAMPSLHFGDRCTIEQLPDADAAITKEVPGSDNIPKMFRVNLAKEQLAFPPEHPYYQGLPKNLLEGFVNPANTALPNYVYDAVVMKKVQDDNFNIGNIAEKHKVSKEDIINLCGGIPTKELKFIKLRGIAENDNLLIVELKTDVFELTRHINFSEKTIYNAYMEAYKPGSGIGTSLFSNQVKSARELGFETINVQAAGYGGTDFWHGYHRWARLGYTMKKESKQRFELWAKNHERTEKTINELVSTNEGYKYWIENGFGWNGTFKLKDRSRNMNYLVKYLKGKKIDFKL